MKFIINVIFNKTISCVFPDRLSVAMMTLTYSYNYNDFTHTYILLDTTLCMA